MTANASYWIDKLELEKHPEGGHFKETYRSDVRVKICCLPDTFDASRSAATAILFLLEGSEFSALHRLRSDEIWNYHAGSGLTVHVIDCDGNYSVVKLGPSDSDEAVFQAVVPAGCWFGATVDEPGSYSLIGCTVSPGFDFKDFELGKREELSKEFPQHTDTITRLTRE